MLDDVDVTLVELVDVALETVVILEEAVEDKVQSKQARS